MNGFTRLALTEGRLFLREKLSVIGVFAFPVGLVVAFGLIPGFGKPQKSLADQIGTEYIAALGIAIVLVSLGLQAVPMVIAQYRERGVLRRLAVTPVRPLTLLVAKMAVWAVAAMLSVVLIVAVSRLAFHVPLPAEPGWFVLSVLLGLASLFALGMLVTAVAPTARSATGLALALYFPNMFLAGVWIPASQMSPALQRAGNFTPLGSALHAVADSWMGIDPRLEYLGIMAGWAVIAGGLAARYFRWDKS
jgi:ABC-2 type transport system permease protein